MVIAGQCLAHVDSLDDYGDILGALMRREETFLHIAADRAAQLAAGSYSSACSSGQAQ